MSTVKECLRKQQPVVYQTLENALLHDRLAHAYLFSGPSGTMKKAAAYLLAQSLLCKEKGFACETCDVCRRIQANEYADMRYLDGTQTSIKKEDILKLQREFQKTALEAGGQKVYIIDHAENATLDALNSLLKFLEEPAASMTAILIVEQLDRLLPTIVSRCQSIPFTALNAAWCYEAVKEELPPLDAYLLSRMLRQKDAILQASESEDYQHARYVFKGMLERYARSAYDAALFLQLEGFPAKQKKYGKQACLYVFDMLLIFFKDCIHSDVDVQDAWYEEQLCSMRAKQLDIIALMQLFMRSRDKLLGSVNIALLMDQVLYEMKEVIR